MTVNSKTEAFERLLCIMNELREKCPWDRKQTFDSLKNNTIEETFELIEAIDNKDFANIQKELGDLLLQIVFYSKMGEEQGIFDIAQVIDSLCDKLIFRHPHVFGDVSADDVRKVVQNWEELKQKERKTKKGLLSGVPKGLPAMVKAYRVQEKTSAVGFDWSEKSQVWDKVKEEVQELQDEIDSKCAERIEEEFGDLFFALVNAARLYGVDPESALQHTNKKFVSRFNYMEEKADGEGKSLGESSLEQMDRWWNEVKKEEKNHRGINRVY